MRRFLMKCEIVIFLILHLRPVYYSLSQHYILFKYSNTFFTRYQYSYNRLLFVSELVQKERTSNYNLINFYI